MQDPFDGLIELLCRGRRRRRLGGASRRHAEIRRDGADFVIVDLGSTNGTLVNDQQVAEATLEDGDRITIGRTVLEFRRT